MNPSSLEIVILAAGQGTRMRSKLPKVLHQLAGKPLLEHLANTAEKLHPKNIFVVYGHAGEKVRSELAHLPVQWVAQTELLGTGHALAQAMPGINKNSRVLVLVGDIPLISVETLQKLTQEITSKEVGVVVTTLPDPSGLGRILRDEKKQVIGIVEEKDATPEQKKISEINTGIFLANANYFQRWLPEIKNQNAQKEFYLTDVITFAVNENITIKTIQAACAEEVQGINDRAQLAQLERYFQQQQTQQLMRAGVTLHDPNRFDLRGELICATDVTIDVNVVIEGKVVIGENSYIGANCILRNVTLGKNVEIKPFTLIENAMIDDHCVIGPFARIRPETKLAQNVHVGNFVEIKKSEVGVGSKINHLSYVGDATIGSKVNIGAGTITCNYDGVNKHRTVIADNVFVGSNTSLIAPIAVGENATIGAGSAVKKQVPADALTLERSEQRTINGWQRPKKKEEK